MKNSFSLSRRSKVFWAFVGLAITFLIAFSIVFYFESARKWEIQKYQDLSMLIADVVSVPQAARHFSDFRVVTPNGKIVFNEGIFTELPPSITKDEHQFEFQWLSLFIISKRLFDGSTILFADDITDAVEAQRLMFGNLLTSTLFLGLLVIVIGWFFTRWIFWPVQHIVGAIENFKLEQDPSLDTIPISGKESDEFVRIARQLESMFSRIRTETRKIEDLSSNIAHELKNSLFGIASTLELALLQKNPRKKIEQVHSQVLRLWEVVQALLLLANKEMGVEKTPLVLETLLRHFSEEDPRISLVGPKRAKWDLHRELFEIAIGNIVGNAKKFTPDDGKIEIRFGENEISVADTGTGISAEQLPFVFDRFYKADSMRPNGSGTGLWLALAKHILEKLHGFSLTITSIVGKGTRVTISKSPEQTPRLIQG